MHNKNLFKTKLGVWMRFRKGWCSYYHSR